MLLLSVVIVTALAFAWFVLKDINTPSNVPIKKADEVNGAPPPVGIPEVKHVEEVVKAEIPIQATKVKKAKITATEKNKKTPGRKKKFQ